MNNMSTSEGSSGSESGWTSYLDHTPTATAYQYDKSHWRSVGLNVDRQNQDTEDLSMVSDASSGPRYMYDGDNFSASASGLDQGKKKQKNQIKQNKLQVQDTYLDDTACSPVKNKFGPFGQSNNQASMMQNQSYSATQHKGKSGLTKHFGFLKSSVSGKAASHKSGGL